MNQPWVYMCPPDPEPLSHLPPHPIPLGCPRALGFGCPASCPELACLWCEVEVDFFFSHKDTQLFQH